MNPKATPEYEQVFKEYPRSAWTLIILSYVINFKFSVILVSSFGGMSRLSGTYTEESWKKFNFFAVLYIFLVFLPFLTDFYFHYSKYGHRHHYTYLNIELLGVMTAICLTLTLLIFQQCKIAGMPKVDLGRIHGLSARKRQKDQGEYGEYDSEFEYYDEDDQQAPESEEESSSSEHPDE